MEWNPDTNDLWYFHTGHIQVVNGKIHRHWLEIRSTATDAYVGTEPLVSADDDVWPSNPQPWSDESQKLFEARSKRRDAGRLWRRCN
jgi:hypothetical protein